MTPIPSPKNNLNSMPLSTGKQENSELAPGTVREESCSPFFSAEGISRWDRTVFLLILVFWFVLATLAICFAGCSSPVFPTDNPILLRLPGAERYSDRIEGVLRPWERAELIKEKGQKGKNAAWEEKNILIDQLLEEYDTTQTTNIRRCCVDALEKIGATTPGDQRLEKLFAKAVYNENLGVQLSGINAWGSYCAEVKSENVDRQRTLAAEKLCSRYRELPFSIEAGADKTNGERKDLRLAIIRNLTRFKLEDSPEILKTLDEALRGEKLDDGALQLGAMRALDKLTGKKYGLDAEQWAGYLDYTLKHEGNAPEELSPLERMSAPDLPMFK